MTAAQVVETSITVGQQQSCSGLHSIGQSHSTLCLSNDSCVDQTFH